MTLMPSPPPPTQVSSSPSSVQLLTILQALLLVGPERGDLWLALEALADRATLLAQDCECVEIGVGGWVCDVVVEVHKGFIFLLIFSL